MLGRKKKTKTVLVPVGKQFIIKKLPRCSIKGCDEYSTDNNSKLPMCQNHKKKVCR